MDKIFINNLKVYGLLGVHAHEQETPREIRISAIASTNITAAARSDDINLTVNYSTLAKQITDFIQTRPHLTIEALIENLAALILQDQQIASIWLRVEKPNAVPAAESVGVEIIRTR